MWGIGLTLGVVGWQGFERAVGKDVEGMALEVANAIRGMIRRRPGVWCVEGTCEANFDENEAKGKLTRHPGFQVGGG